MIQGHHILLKVFFKFPQTKSQGQPLNAMRKTHQPSLRSAVNCHFESTLLLDEPAVEVSEIWVDVDLVFFSRNKCHGENSNSGSSL
jgi:hypothetical protein